MHVRWLFLSVILLGLFSIISLAGPVINEVAWGGAPNNPTAEWIELYNPGDQVVQLDGWRLYSSDGAPDIRLHGTIPAHGYFLLERGSDGTVPGVKADLVYTGALRDTGEALFLADADGKYIDSVNKSGGPWPAGTNALGDPPCASMERIDPTVPDTPANWATGRTGGTPDAQNSVYNPPPVLRSFSFTPSLPHPDEPVLFKAKVKSGNIPLFMWDFGDGGTGAGQTVSHTYDQVGSYVVSLQVKSKQGAIAQKYVMVRVIPKRRIFVDFSVLSPNSKQVYQSGDILRFSDESFIALPGKLTAWAWAFGDGNKATGQTASHTYAHGGDYVITHTVIDAQGDTAVQTRALTVVGRYPIAQFNVAPSHPNVGEPVTFAATGSFDPDGTTLSYEWDFDGDGTTDLVSAVPTVTHTYFHSGDYSSRLIVRDRDADGAKRSLPAVVTVHVNQSPHACFKLSNFSPMEGETVKFSDCSSDPDGKIIGYHWVFSDGETSDISSPVHTYSCAGKYTITLTVTDDNGAQASTSAVITVRPVRPRVAIGVHGLAEQLTNVPFTFNASASTPCSKRRITSYEWDFDGDGTYDQVTNCPTVTHAYTHVSKLKENYQVAVRVTDTAGLRAVSTPVTITVDDRPPPANFTWKPEDPTDATAVTFDDKSTDPDGKVVAWSWSFSDGGQSTEQNPIHQFPDDGMYMVTLVVTDDSGAKSLTSQVVTVTNARPVAKFAVPATAVVGAPVQFLDNSSDPSPHGMIVHTAWNFGDGTTCPGTPGGCGSGSLTAPTHIYATPGTYTVELVVIDDDGGLTRVSKQITVSAPHQ